MVILTIEKAYGLDISAMLEGITGVMFKNNEAFMHLDRSTSTVEKTRHYLASPSPLAMTPDEFHAASHLTAELAAEYYAERAEKPVYTAPSREVLERLRASALPERGLSAQEILHYFAREIMPYDMGNQQPTFSPWVNPAAAPISMFL